MNLKILICNIGKIFAGLVPNKGLRRKLRDHCHEHLWHTSNAKQLKQFLSHKIKPRSVFIVEPNTCHGEVLPGLMKYFQDLGFSVDIFIRHEVAMQGPLCRIQQQPDVFTGTPKQLKFLLSQEKIKEYEYLFLSTPTYCAHNECVNYLEHLDFIPQTKRGILQMCHSVDQDLKKSSNLKYLNENRVFSLSGFCDVPMLNPHYFGPSKKVKSRQKQTIFITVGKYQKRRNFELLFEAVTSLIKKGKNNFKIITIGRKIHVPFKLKKYVTVEGKVPFAQMYDMMDKADFYLPLLDPKLPAHIQYLNDVTTGSRQLILGFETPCLINEEFARAYDFNADNSIPYCGTNLASAMEQALNLADKEYSLMQQNLKKSAEKIYKKSLNNLENTLKQHERIN